MVFTAQPMQPLSNNVKRIKKATFPFEAMKANKESSGFVIPAERSDLFTYARVMASKFNQANGTAIRCNKLHDGSLRVWNEKIETAGNTAKQRNATKQTSKEQQPTKQQFIDWIKGSLQPGMSYTFQVEFVHRFDEFRQWAKTIEGCETETKYNPPSLKISRKGNRVNSRLPDETLYSRNAL